MAENAVILAAAVAVLIVLFSPAWRRSSLWHATATPLASIIGSGFLVIAPLMALTFGPFAIGAMTALVVYAYLVGGILRFTIAHVEPLLLPGARRPTRNLAVLPLVSDVAKLALAFAYFTSVAFYLLLFSAFALRALGVSGTLGQKALTTAMLALIGWVGRWRGLRVLERLERYAVATKLAAIAALLVGLADVNLHAVAAGTWAVTGHVSALRGTALRQLMGMLLVVQGFETSRYLQGAYAPAERIRSMRLAQVVSGLIYVTFIGLVSLLFGRFQRISDTAIIDYSRLVAPILPPMLYVGALMSQFSAAIADTIGAGGLLEEGTRRRLSRRSGYALVAAAGIGLIWLTPIFALIGDASRAFALFYALQGLLAMLVCWRDPGGRRHWGRLVGFGLLTISLLAVTLWGLPATA